MMDEYCTAELVKRREELKIDLNRTIGERNSALEELARVTEERDSLQAKLDEAVDKALELAKERDALREKLERSMELPLDADGVPIRVGDYLQLGETRGEVVALTYCPDNGKLPWEWQSDTGDWYNTAFAYHVKPRTLEDVLREFTDAVFRWDAEDGTVADTDTWSEIVKPYAAEIRELLSGDAE